MFVPAVSVCRYTEHHHPHSEISGHHTAQVTPHCAMLVWCYLRLTARYMPPAWCPCDTVHYLMRYFYHEEDTCYWHPLSSHRLGEATRMQCNKHHTSRKAQCGVSTRGAQCSVVREPIDTVWRCSSAICISKRWDIDRPHFTLTRIPSLCEVNSGAYMHWMVVSPLL